MGIPIVPGPAVYKHPWAAAATVNHQAIVQVGIACISRINIGDPCQVPLEQHRTVNTQHIIACFRYDSGAWFTCGSDFPFQSSWHGPFQWQAVGRVVLGGRAPGRWRAAVWRKVSGAGEGPGWTGWNARTQEKGTKNSPCHRTQERWASAEYAYNRRVKGAKPSYITTSNQPSHGADCLQRIHSTPIISQSSEEGRFGLLHISLPLSTHVTMICWEKTPQMLTLLC